MRKLLFVILILLIVAVVFSFFKKKILFTAHDLQPKQALELILNNQTNSNFVIIDVRTEKEFNSGYINGAINIDWESNKNDLLSINKNDELLLYCQSGRRSKLAQTFLIENGFKSVSNINGGLIKWNKAISF